MGAPVQRGIEGLHPRVFNRFFGGRVTNINLTTMPDEVCLVANNVLFLGDNRVSKRPGYTLVGQPTAAQVLALFDFQRQSDGKQFLLSQYPGKLYASGVTSPLTPQLLSSSEDPSAKFQFSALDFACYMSNGVDSHRLVDKAGALTLYKWGMDGPPTAPTIALGSGTLSLTYGRQYVYCPVSKVTDSNGVTRVSVGPPSPISAHTGPFTNQVVTVGDIFTDLDPQCTHVWIFATYDTPLNTTSVFNFAGEIANGTTSFGDSLTDDQLDFTRIAPFGTNYPAPFGEIVLQFQSRMVILRIPASPTEVQFSALGENPVGVPQECFPADLFFTIPGGSQQPTAGIVYGEGVGSRLCISTDEYWWIITGYDVNSFQKRDRVATPGAVGPDAVTCTNRHLIYVTKSKKLMGWDTQSKPLEISRFLAQPLAGSMSMEDLSSTELANCKVKWFQYGRSSYILVFAATANAPAGTYDWIQVWDASQLEVMWPNLPTLSDGSSTFMAESDFWPSDIMAAAAIVNVAGQDYVFMGDAAGNIHRWPDGYLDNGKAFTPVWGSAWTPGLVFIGQMFHPVPTSEVQKRFFFADLVCGNRNDVATAFQLFGITLQGPNMGVLPIDCKLEPAQSSMGLGADACAARADLKRVGVSVGKWARFFVIFPDDNLPAAMDSLAISARPVYGVRP